MTKTKTKYQIKSKLKAKFLLFCKAIAIKLGRVVTYDEVNSPMMWHDPQITSSRESIWQIKTKYLLFWKVYGNQTWHGSGVWWGKLTHYFTWPSDHVSKWGHGTIWKLYISSSTKAMITKLSEIVTYDEGNSVIMWRDSLTTETCKAMR